MNAHPFERNDLMVSVPTATNGRPTTKFWDAKTHTQRRHAKDLVIENPALLAVLTFAAYYAWEAWSKKLVITSVLRHHDDPKQMHQNWRAADVRVFDAERDGERGHETVITPSEAQELIGMINRTFRYGRTWLGRKTVVAHYRTGTDSDTAPHIHLQTPRRWW